MQTKLGIILILLFVHPITKTFSQSSEEPKMPSESPFYTHLLDVGMNLGFSQYIGDLNTYARPRFLLPSAGAFIKKSFDKHDIAFKLSINYLRLKGNDRYSRDPLQKIRNLEFRSNLIELGALINMGYFTLYSKNREWRHYLITGANVFSYNPFATLGKEKIFLRPLGTEGQFSYLQQRPTPYGKYAFSFSLGHGLRTNIGKTTLFFAEFNYRFSNTGYIDDVYGTYAGYESFQPDGPTYNSTLARSLQNRSKKITWGEKGTRRGNGKNDHYYSIQMGIEFQFWKRIYKHRLKYNKFRIFKGKAPIPVPDK